MIGTGGASGTRTWGYVNWPVTLQRLARSSILVKASCALHNGRQDACTTKPVKNAGETPALQAMDEDWSVLLYESEGTSAVWGFGPLPKRR